MPADDDQRAREEASGHSRFRDANERLRRIAASYRFEAGDRAPFICECADPGCFESVMLSLDEYDRVRVHPTWFVLVAGHEGEEATCEHVLEAEHGYTIVEMTGAAGAEAARLQGSDGGVG